jgi:hypothetical protein
MRNQRQFWPGQIKAARFLAVFMVLFMVSVRALAPVPVPFQLSMSPKDSDSFVLLTVSGLFNGEFNGLILQENDDLTTTNWVNIQTNLDVTAPQSYFSYRVTAQSPKFFRVAGIP